MSTCRQLSLEERCPIARLHEAGQSIRKIASVLERKPYTISRELKRNAGAKIGHRPAYAQAQAAARRWHGCRLEREDALRQTVLDRLAREAGHPVISHETIYRFVHARRKRINDRRWRHYLPRGRYKRGWRNRHIGQQIRLDTWFCDSRSLWQKGSVENAIGRLRHDIPRKTERHALSQRKLDAILARHSHTPRKCLGFQASAEAFIPLHFNCASTPGSSPG